MKLTYIFVYFRPCNYYLFDHILKDLNIKEEQFVKTHSDVNVETTSKEEFLTQVEPSQLCDKSQLEYLRKDDKIESVSLVEMTDTVSSILGVSTETYGDIMGIQRKQVKEEKVKDTILSSDGVKCEKKSSVISEENKEVKSATVVSECVVQSIKSEATPNIVTDTKPNSGGTVQPVSTYMNAPEKNVPLPLAIKNTDKSNADISGNGKREKHYGKCHKDIHQKALKPTKPQEHSIGVKTEPHKNRSPPVNTGKSNCFLSEFQKYIVQNSSASRESIFPGNVCMTQQNNGRKGDGKKGRRVYTNTGNRSYSIGNSFYCGNKVGSVGGHMSSLTNGAIVTMPLPNNYSPAYTDTKTAEIGGPSPLSQSAARSPRQLSKVSTQVSNVPRLNRLDSQIPANVGRDAPSDKTVHKKGETGEHVPQSKNIVQSDTVKKVCASSKNTAHKKGTKGQEFRVGSVPEDCFVDLARKHVQRRQSTCEERTISPKAAQTAHSNVAARSSKVTVKVRSEEGFEPSLPVLEKHDVVVDEVSEDPPPLPDDEQISEDQDPEMPQLTIAAY